MGSSAVKHQPWDLLARREIYAAAPFLNLSVERVRPPDNGESPLAAVRASYWRKNGIPLRIGSARKVILSVPAKMLQCAFLFGGRPCAPMALLIPAISRK